MSYYVIFLLNIIYSSLSEKREIIYELIAGSNHINHEKSYINRLLIVRILLDVCVNFRNTCA